MSRMHKWLVALALAVVLALGAVATASACPYDPPSQDQQYPPPL
jgi:hypothetical protein